MGMMSEFKEFAIKGNAVDMAVGIVIGTSQSYETTAARDNEKESVKNNTPDATVVEV